MAVVTDLIKHVTDHPWRCEYVPMMAAAATHTI